jgi:hypothetical protein
MNGDGRPRNRRERRGEPACGGTGQGSGRRAQGATGSASGLGGRAATRALIAVGAYVVQDLRDAQGLTRPLLRRAALLLARSPSQPVRRVGGAYLRLDPPPSDEAAAGPATSGRPAAPPLSLPAPSVSAPPYRDGAG